MTTPCKYDNAIGKMQATCQNMSEDVGEVKDTTKNIYKILNGNGQEGLVTRTARLEQRMNDQPSPRILIAYSSTAGGLIVLLGVAAKFLFGL